MNVSEYKLINLELIKKLIIKFLKYMILLITNFYKFN